MYDGREIEQMNESKRRREGPQLIYLHTSTLRTNQLWMSGLSPHRIPRWSSSSGAIGELGLRRL